MSPLICRDGDGDERLPLCLHEWDVIAHILRAPIDAEDPVRHTMFVIMGCVRCRAADAFPPTNAMQALSTYVATLRRELGAGGWLLPDDITWGGGWH